MAKRIIDLFMWGYQPHFRSTVQYRMESALRELGVIDVDVKCLLVGARKPGSENPNPICVEPEDGQWPLELFEGLLDAIEQEYDNHPDQNIMYGDEPSMRDKPENMRRDSVRRTVQKVMDGYDSINGACSFAGPAAPVGDYYVVPVLQLPVDLFDRFRPLRTLYTDLGAPSYPSLIHAVKYEVLQEAFQELLRPDPGRSLSFGNWATAPEIVRRAAYDFIRTLGMAITTDFYMGPDLFERLNLISSMMYEGTKGTGSMLLANPASQAIETLIELADPVPFSEARWCRKVLQMASGEIALLIDLQRIIGLGRLKPGADPWDSQDVFRIEFLDHYHWNLACGDEVLIISKYGAPSLPQEPLPTYRVAETFNRLFTSIDDRDDEAFRLLYETARAQSHGSTLVVAQDAAEEAARLHSQGSRIAPIKLTPELFMRVCDIDGAILIDPQCVCHAIGVILDGPAHEDCTPSRGSRYNSGVRYVHSSPTPRLAIVVSDDHSVDVIPLLKPRIRRSEIAEKILELEAATYENFHPAINWLEERRFYLDQDACDRLNSALEKIYREHGDRVGFVISARKEFVPDDEFTDDYFEHELQGAEENTDEA